jgi:hypothetical protein
MGKYAEAFRNWKAQSASAQPSPGVAPVAPTGEHGSPIADEPLPRLQTYRALADHPFGVEIATAPSLEKERLGDAGVARLIEFGIDIRDLR